MPEQDRDPPLEPVLAQEHDGAGASADATGAESLNGSGAKHGERPAHDATPTPDPYPTPEPVWERAAGSESGLEGGPGPDLLELHAQKPQFSPVPPPVPAFDRRVDLDRSLDLERQRQRRAALGERPSTGPDPARWSRKPESWPPVSVGQVRPRNNKAAPETLPSKQPNAARRPVDPLAWWVIAGAALLGIALYWSATRTTLSGTVVATGPTLGNWTMNVDSCHADSVSVPQQFTLEDSTHPVLRMTVKTDPQNPPSIQVTSSVDGQMHPVEFDRCGEDRVEATVPATSKVLNGNLVLLCTVGQSRLTAQVNFENCR